MYYSFLSYKKAKYLWVALALSTISLLLYFLPEPSEPPSGGTWLGYTLGTIGALLIVWLMWFGVRKRSYMSTSASVQGWLSAHVYLGSSLLIVGTLHSAAQFSWNVHTLAYVLMCVVIVSGFYGVYTYIRYPSLMAINLGNVSRVEILQEVTKLDAQCLRIAEKLHPDIQEIVRSAVSRTMIGGGFWTQLFGLDHSKIMQSDRPSSPNKTILTRNKYQQIIIDYLADKAAKSSGGQEAIMIQQLLDGIVRKRNQLAIVRRDIQLQAMLKAWLYVHIPLSFALLAALTVHIITVFFYW